MEQDYLEQLQRRRQSEGPPRDKWITPLLDWQVGECADMTASCVDWRLQTSLKWSRAC
jgi:hypothetical protein